MRKSLVLLAVISLLVMACSAYAVPTTATLTMHLYGKWNYIAAPLVPFTPNVWDDGSSPQPHTPGIFSDWVWAGVPDSLDPDIGRDSLKSWDAVVQGGHSFPSEDLSLTSGSNILMGEGYVAGCSGAIHQTTHSLTVTGVDITDSSVYISLPGMANGSGGWHYVGIPFPSNYGVNWWNIIVTDGSTSKALWELYEANDQSWINLSFAGWNGYSQGGVNIPSDGDFLRGGYMYKIKTKVNNLALILPVPDPDMTDDVCGFLPAVTE